MEDSRRYILSTNPGNNVQMIEHVILTRPWWEKAQSGAHFNLHYQETTPKFERNSPTCVYNHMPENSKFHSKWKLYQALQHAMDAKIGDITKPTYLYDGFDRKRFEAHFQFQKTKTGIRLPCYDAECQNIWIMKPLSLNRGRGIAIIKSLEEAAAHQRQFPEQKFLVQQYIECPILYEQRKFDIRCYALVTHGGSGYVYEEGYLRLSSVPYDAQSDSLTAHLTNNEYQNKVPEYSRFEEGNMVSFSQFDAYSGGVFLQQTWPRIQQMMATTLLAVGSIQGASINCFELLGFDFMLEGSLSAPKPVLIEVNMNPCMKLASPISWSLLPFLIDDMMQLTIDRWFKAPSKLLQQLNATNQRLKEQNQLFERKPAEYYANLANRKFEGLRWDALRGEYAVLRKNGFAQVMLGWRTAASKEQGRKEQTGK